MEVAAAGPEALLRVHAHVHVHVHAHVHAHEHVCVQVRVQVQVQVHVHVQVATAGAEAHLSAAAGIRSLCVPELFSPYVFRWLEQANSHSADSHLANSR